MSTRILVVEDDPKIAALVADYLNDAGYATTCSADGAQALALARGQPGFGLFVLDVMLPGMDGIALCRALRAFSDAPIILLTARVEEIDRLLGLDSGADDYVCKPFSPRELVARVRAHLRRGGPSPAPAAPLAVDRAQMRILHGGVALPLTPVEFRLLAELVEHPDRVYSRQQLLDAAHEDQRETNDRAVDSHIKNIRRKLAAALPDTDCLQSVYGVGYRFELPR
ncbi:MAG: response regulator [Pseudoduganella sp.]|jgi:two-component system response regulator BaeR|nr:response regulator [Pseudoduganella sp.]